VTGEAVSFPQITVGGTAATGRARTTTLIGTVGGEDGRFSLEVPARQVVLTVLRIGYRSANVTVPTDQAVVDVALTVDYLNVEELVVTGRATETRRANLPTSIGTVSGDEINQVPQQTVDGAIAGRVSGVVIGQNSGAPGGGFQLEIRGNSSLFAAAEPLYVIDGVIASNAAIPSNQNVITEASGGSNPAQNQDVLQNRLADINPEDIETIEVLKGASAAAVYGAKAANGVVIITTRRGGTGAADFRLGFQGGTFDLSNKLGFRRFQSPEEAIADIGELSAEFCTTSPCPFFDNEQALADRNDFSWQATGTVSGGDPNSFSYFGSLMWKNDEGIIDNTGFERQSIRANLTPTIAGGAAELAIAANVIHTNAQRGLTNNDNANVSYYMVLPFAPSFQDLSQRPDGTFPENVFTGNLSNPLQTAALLENDEDVFRYIVSTNLDWRLVNTDRHSFKIVAPFGVDYFQQDNRLFSPPEIFWEPADGLLGTALQSNSNSLNLNVGGNGVWDWRISEGSRLTNAFGLSYERVDTQVDRIIGQNLTAGKNKADAATVVQVRENALTVEDFGFYYQVEYLGADDKLLIGGALRFDQSSANFDTDKLFAYPKGYVSYRFTDLGSAVSEIKLRAAYGESGNRPVCTLIEGCQKFTSLTLDSNIEGLPGFGIEGTIGQVVECAACSTPSLQPERMKEFEGGVDLTGWGGRFTLELTGYRQTIKDQLIQQAVAPSTGFEDFVFNAGSMRNWGFETTLGLTPFVSRSFTWLSRTTFFFNRTQMTELPIPGFDIRGAGGPGFACSLGCIFIEEGSSSTTMAANDPRCTGEQSDDCTSLPGVGKVGNTNPAFTMAFTNDFTFLRNFSFYSLLEWRQGQSVVNLTEFLADLGPTSGDYVGDDPVTVPEDCEPNCSGQQRQFLRGQLGFSGVYTQPAGFLKVRELSLTYDLPFQSGVFKSIRLRVSGRNLWTVTNYRGLDPEVSNFGNQQVGRSQDVAPFPPSRSFWAGFDLAI
jgi:TonB-linked SusC/RagA family outer membrane protein